MILDKYKQNDNEPPKLVCVEGMQYVAYEPSSIVVQFKHVPLEQVTPEAIREILLTPGVDHVEIAWEG